MGLEMPEEEDGFASRILLMRAGNKSRAQSWLKASLGEDKEAQDGTISSPTEDAVDVIVNLQGNGENSGVGAPKKQTEDDIGLDRQALSANEALRKKLLSKEAYQRYQQGKGNKLDASKPMPKLAKNKGQDGSDEEEKGRSGVVGRKQSSVGDSGSGTAQGDGAHHKVLLSSKKRPGSYLDQLLAERGKKKKSKSKSEDG